MPLDCANGFHFSPEQTDIARFVMDEKGNLIVLARAGTGKSTLLRKVIPLFCGKVAVLVFGKEASLAMQAKCAEEGIKADIGTFHSFGFSVLRRAYPKAKVLSAGKKFDLIAQALSIPQHLCSFVQKAMSMAMQRGFGVFHPLNDKQAWFDLVDHFDLENELGEDNIGLKLKGREATVREGMQFACKAVKLGLQMVHEHISFDDMMFAPLALNLTFPTYPNLAVDEAQDSNACRREIARRMSSGRSMWVGDDMQAIMGFTGADNDAMDQIKTQFDCTSFPMTETRRCSQAVVSLAKTIIHDYKAHPSNPEGSCTTITENEFNRLSLRPGLDAVICRKTAPLVSVCYSLIARGTPAKVIGKDIGEGLLAMCDRWKTNNLVTLKDRLEAYREKMVAKYLAEKNETLAEAIADKVEALLTLINALPAQTATVADLRAQITTMFQPRPDGTTAPFVALMTAHKSKGLEFERVFGYGNDRWFPSRFAKQEWQVEQENFLLGVLWTRAKLDYVDVTVEED